MTRRTAETVEMLDASSPWQVTYYCPHCRTRVWMDLVYIGVGNCTRCSIEVTKSDALCQSYPAGATIPRWLDSKR